MCFKRNPTKRSDKYFHESGHIILNKLFDEAFKFEFVTVDEATSKKLDIQSSGGVRGKYLIPLQQRSVLDHDKAFLGSLAGLCIDELVLNSRVINEDFFQSHIGFQKLQNEHKYSGDRDFAGTTFSYMKSEINILFKEYLASALKTVFKILNDDIIWQSIAALRQRLMTQHTLYSDEVDQILTACGFSEWKIKNKDAIIQERRLLLSRT